MLLKAKKLHKMFKGLKEDTDLDIVRLNAYRSHFQLPVLIAEVECDESEEIEVENVEIVEEMDEEEEEVEIKTEVELDQVIYEEPIEEIVEEYLEDEEVYPYHFIILQDRHEKSQDDEEVKNFNKMDYDSLFTFKCHLCSDPEFSKMAELSAHCRETHNALPSVRCCSDECGKMLSTLRRLIIHKERHFPSDKVLKCHQCHRVFSTIVGFERHKKVSGFFLQGGGNLSTFRIQKKIR